jgi:hypothetical protein
MVDVPMLNMILWYNYAEGRFGMWVCGFSFFVSKGRREGSWNFQHKINSITTLD